MLVVSPTYEGACFDVESISNICHAAGVPLVVDEAHGAHLAFLEEEDGRSEFPKGEGCTVFHMWSLRGSFGIDSRLLAGLDLKRFMHFFFGLCVDRGD